MRLRNWKTYADQFRLTLKHESQAIHFIRRYRLWEGLQHYGWLAKVLLFFAFLAGLKFISIFFNWINQIKLSSAGQAFQSMGMFFHDFALGGYEFVFSGTTKYLILILAEVLVFHCCRRTIQILMRRNDPPVFKDFIDAQKRMIAVAIYSWVMELVFTILIKIATGIVSPLAFLEEAAIFIVQCYFLGFAIIDNYHEQFGLSIKESAKLTQNYLGVAFAAGLSLYLIMLIPLAGVIIAPIIVTVAVAHTMYSVSDLHLLGKDIFKKVEEFV
ncbi:MAG TPA: hypothetical protein PKA00_21175 [Saprospiraceae bacterium]|nr:hypothetical protein [Saprospiraceae bacterium]HMQ85436.1 hypothetical protein [Saprospiraceae bacterium]